MNTWHRMFSSKATFRVVGLFKNLFLNKTQAHHSVVPILASHCWNLLRAETAQGQASLLRLYFQDEVVLPRPPPQLRSLLSFPLTTFTFPARTIFFFQFNVSLFTATTFYLASSHHEIQGSMKVFIYYF